MFAAKNGWAVALLACACGTSQNADDAHPAAAGRAGSGAAGAPSGGSAGDAASAGTSGGGAGLAGASSGGAAAAGAAAGGVGGGGAGGATSGGSAGSAGTSGSSGGSAGSDTPEGGAGPVDQGTPTYEPLAALPMPRQEHGVGALNGEVYVVGGYTPDLTASTQVYTPSTDSWRDVADFPDVLHHPNVAAVGGLLYVTGFHIAGGRRIADGRAFAYDPVEDAWTPRASLPTGTERGASCVTTLGTKIYVFGGTNDLTLPDASAYDTELDSWEALPPMPALRQHCLAATVAGKIYIVSGRNVGIEGLEEGSWVYDPVTRAYEARAPIPTPRGGTAGGALGGRIFVFGGEGNADDPMGVFHEAEAYDPATDLWESLPDLLVPRHGFGGAVIGDRIYLPGGSTSQGVDTSDVNTVFFFMPAP